MLKRLGVHALVMTLVTIPLAALIAVGLVYLAGDALFPSLDPPLP